MEHPYSITNVPARRVSLSIFILTLVPSLLLLSCEPYCTAVIWIGEIIPFNSLSCKT